MKTADKQKTTGDELMAKLREVIDSRPGLKQYVTARAAGAMVDDIVADKQKGEDLLRSAWGVVVGAVNEFTSVNDSPPELLTCVLFLHEYFGHRGDWDAMRKCMDGAANSIAEKHGLGDVVKVVGVRVERPVDPTRG